MTSVDLLHGVVPISKAASTLAHLIRQADRDGRPVVITQKGYPQGVLLTVPQFLALRAQAQGIPYEPPTPTGISEAAEGSGDEESD